MAKKKDTVDLEVVQAMAWVTEKTLGLTHQISGNLLETVMKEREKLLDVIEGARSALTWGLPKVALRLLSNNWTYKEYVDNMGDNPIQRKAAKQELYPDDED